MIVDHHLFERSLTSNIIHFRTDTIVVCIAVELMYLDCGGPLMGGELYLEADAQQTNIAYPKCGQDE